MRKYHKILSAKNSLELFSFVDTGYIDSPFLSIFFTLLAA